MKVSRGRCLQLFSVFNLITARLKQKLVTDTDAPYYSETITLTESTVSVSASNFPCLLVSPLGEGNAGSNLQNEQCYINSVIELQSYVAPSPNGTQAKAREIINNAGDVMLTMGYQLFDGYPLNNSTSDYYRTIARFKRVVGTGDELY